MAQIEALTAEKPGEPIVLLRPDTVPEDIAMITRVSGLLTARGEGRAPSLKLLAVMILWANLHASFAIGLILMLPFGIEAAWEDRRVVGLVPGVWTVRYCVDSGCGELNESIRYSEEIEDENLQYRVALIRFGPAPRERPAAHPITREEFAAE